MKNSTLITQLGLSSALFISAQLQAQEPTEIVITAKGQQTLADIAATAHVITAEDIATSQAQNVTEILNTVSGISTRNSGSRGSTSGVFVRGTTGSQIVVLIDGVRSGSATTGSTEMSHLPIEAIERIEIIKGPLSGLYGADAMGGVIQIFTKKGAADGAGSIAISAGSNNFQKAVLSVNAGTDSHYARATIANEETDGIDSTSILTEGNQDDDGFEADNVNLVAGFALSDNTQLRMSHLQTDNEAEFDNTFGADTGFLSENSLKNTAIALDSKLTHSLQWQTTLGKQSNETITKAFDTNIQSDRLNLTTQLEKQFSANQILTIGVDAYDEDVDSKTDFPVSDRDNKGLFTQLQQTLGNLGLVANLRVDDNSAYGSDTNGSLALNSQLSEHTRLTVSYGTAFRAPTFNDLYFPGYGNSDIKPEESESLEVSLRGNTTAMQWRVSAFNTDVKNLIGFDSATFLATNTADASLQGIELEVSTNIHDWHLAANLDLLSAEDDSTGKELDDRVERSLNLSASRRFGKLSTQIAVLAEDGRHDLSGTELSSFAKVDVRGAYEVSKNFNISASINNLFDKDYSVNLISPTAQYNTAGRTVSVTGKYTF